MSYRYFVSDSDIIAIISAITIRYPSSLLKPKRSRNTFFIRKSFFSKNFNTCATAQTFLEARQAWRQYLVNLTEYYILDYEQKKEKEYHPWWKRWLLRSRKIDFSQNKQDLSNIKEWLEIVMAREKGELPALEGIRIVRERKNLE